MTTPSDEAAKRIQALWRGHKARQAHMPPTTSRPTAYKTEHFPQDVVFKETIPGYFVYVGVSGLVNLAWIKEISQGSHVPKMYIVDNSGFVRDFWLKIKEVFATSKDYDAFKANVLLFKADFNKNSHGDARLDASTRIIRTMNGLLSDDETGAWYEYFKEALASLTVICADWANPDVFEYIRSHTDPKVPIVCYASNIVEMAGVGQQHERFSPESDTRAAQIIHNISMLNAQDVIHERTTLASNKKSHSLISLSPDTYLINPTEDELDGQKYVPITQEAYQRLVDKIERESSPPKSGLT